MRPMSLYESGDSSGDISLEAICTGDAPSKITGEVDLRNIIGFYYPWWMARQSGDNFKTGGVSA